MLLDNFNISVFDKEIQKILTDLSVLKGFVCVQTKEHDFEVYFTENGYKTDALDGGFNTRLPHATICFRGANGKKYRYMKGYAKPIFESTDYNGNTRTVTEKTVVNQLKAKVKQMKDFQEKYPSLF